MENPSNTIRSDHDTLVRLEVLVNQIGLDIKELKDGISAKLNEHDTRIDKHELRLNRIDSLIEVIKPEQTVAEFHQLQQQVHDFTVRANLFRLLAGIGGGIVVFLTSQIPAIVKLFQGQ